MQLDEIEICTMPAPMKRGDKVSDCCDVNSHDVLA